MHACKVTSVVSDSCDPVDCNQAPLPMGFSRQEYWSGLPFSFPGALPNPGNDPGSPALQANSLTAEPPGRPWFNSWVRKIHRRRDRLPIPVYLGFPCGSADKESPCNAGDQGLTPGLGRSPGEENGNSNIPAWKVPWTEKPEGLQLMGSQESDRT